MTFPWMKIAHRIGRGLGLMLLVLASLAAGAKTIYVTNTNDDGPGSLRQALREAVDGDVVELDPNLAGQTIVLSEPIRIGAPVSRSAAAGPAAINYRLLLWFPYRPPRPASLDETSASTTPVWPAAIDVVGSATISGGDQTHLFEIGPTASVTIEGLVLADGRHQASGGAIDNAGTLTLKNCWLRDNAATMSGGAISNRSAALLTVDDSTLSGNVADLRGGAIANSGTATLRRSTLFANEALEGGGLYTDGTATAAHLTASWNHASNYGGGVVIKNSGGSLTLINSLVAGNTATTAQGQEIYNIGGRYIGLGGNLLGQNSEAGIYPLTETGFAPNPNSREQTVNLLAPTLDKPPQCTLTLISAARDIGDLNMAINNGVQPVDNKADVGAVQYEDYHTLQVTRTGLGTVISTPELLDWTTGLNCGNDCVLGNFPGGSTVTLTATAAAGYRFDGWGEACAGTSGPSCGVTLTSNQAVTAIFAPEATPTLKFDVGAAGTISWFYTAAFGRTPVPNSGLANYGDLGGLAFWTNQYLGGLDAQPVFVGQVYAIADFFTVSPEFQTQYPGSLTDEEFVRALYGNMLGRAADTGGLAYWAGLLDGGASRGTVLAQFTNSPENRDANPLRKAALESYIGYIAADRDLTITVAEGGAWLAQNPTLDGALVDNPASPVYTLALATSGTGSGTVSGGGRFAAGSTVKLTATPEAGSIFARWSPNPCAASFTMPATDLTCTATFTPSSGVPEPEMVTIPGGTFLMGSPPTETGRKEDEQRHSVTVVSFAMGKYEVTFEEYDRFAEATGQAKPDDQGWGRGRRPVINVSWQDALAYADWLSTQTGRAYRLPTEAEWEHAARAGTTTPFWTGNCVTTAQANYYGHYGYGDPDCGANTGLYRAQTLEVGAFPANPWGLHDTMGNVWEWTCSLYQNPYNGEEQACNTINNNGNFSLRGGSWFAIPNGIRSAFRSESYPMLRSYELGFRLARSL